MDKISTTNKQFFIDIIDSLPNNIIFIFYQSSLQFKHNKCYFVNQCDLTQPNLLFAMNLFDNLPLLDIIYLQQSGLTILCAGNVNTSNHILHMDTGLILSDDEINNKSVLINNIFDVQSYKNAHVIKNLFTKNNMIIHNCLVYRLIFESTRIIQN